MYLNVEHENKRKKRVLQAGLAKIAEINANIKILSQNRAHGLLQASLANFNVKA